MIETETTETATQQPLPAGWRWARLGDVCEFSYGSALPERSRQEGAVPIYGSNGIVGYHNAPLTAGPTIIIGRKGSIGEVHVSDVPCWPIDTTYYIEQSWIDTDLQWLAYCLKHLKLQNLNKAAAVPGLNRVDAYSIWIPLPPHHEQRRIAAILRERMAAVERARAAAEAQLAAARALPAAYLRAVFESAEAQEWPRVRLGSVAKVQAGYAFKSEWFIPNGIRLLRNANIFQDYISWQEQVCLPWPRRREFPSYELEPGDIVLSLDRPMVSNGLKVARLSIADVPSLLLQRVARFQLSGDLEPDFLYTFLHTRTFISEITKHNQSLGVPHISPKQVESVRVPLPSLNQQQRMARDIRTQTERIQQLCDSAMHQLHAINALPQALLRQAFSGAL